MFAWAMITLPLEGIYKEDPSWLYGIGWAIVLISTLLIFFIGYCVISKQHGYTFKDVSIFSSYIRGEAKMSKHSIIHVYIRDESVVLKIFFYFFQAFY